MTFWDEIYELVRKVDDENLRIYVNIYNLPDDEGKILVFDDWDSSKAFNKLLAEKIRNYPEVQKEIEDFRYDVDDRDDWFLDLATEDNWTYADEGFDCSDCYKFYRYNNGWGGGYANYFVGDGFIVCEDCLKKNYKEQWLAEHIDNPDNANTIFDNSELREMGFEKVNNFPYANGMYHGENDNPKEILERAKELYPDYEFLFSVVKDYNPFHTEFNLWKRETA